MTPTTIALILRSLAGAVLSPGVFGEKAAKLGPVLDALGAIAELPDALAPERSALKELVERWVAEDRPPTDEELAQFRSVRDARDAELRQIRDSLPTT